MDQSVGATVAQAEEAVQPAEPDDILEVNERWSFAGSKHQQRWLWTAMCRRPRQIVAFVIGDRSKKSCQRLWNKLPDV